jgi:hypothetical protein
MPCGATDVFQVVVLAAGADALLGGGGAHVLPALLPEEHRLELHHARIGEEQGGVLGGHKRGRSDHSVAVAPEVLEEALAKLVTRDHGPVSFSLYALALVGRLAEVSTHETLHDSTNERRGIAAAQEIAGQAGRSPIRRRATKRGQPSARGLECSALLRALEGGLDGGRRQLARDALRTELTGQSEAADSALLSTRLRPALSKGLIVQVAARLEISDDGSCDFGEGPTAAQAAGQLPGAPRLSR